MKIADVKECLERMHAIYAFKDDETDMRLEHDLVSGRENIVSIKTYDEKSGVDIELSTKPPTDLPFRN